MGVPSLNEGTGVEVEELTELQENILRALARQVEKRGVNFKALADHFGITPPTLREHLDAIARKGHLELHSYGKGRSPQIRLRGQGVPLIGYIRAGSLAEALEYPEGYLRLPYYPGKFGLRVEGDSMADAIQDGDVVVLQKRAYKSGEVCAVRVDNSDATLKYLDVDVDQGLVRLRPHNPAYQTLELETHRIAVDGVFAGLLRGGLIADMLEERAMH